MRTVYLAVASMIFAQQLFAQSAPGDTADLGTAKQLRQIAAQKVEADMRDALRDADRTMKSDPQAAVSRLNEGLAVLDSDKSLTDVRKQTLTRVLRDRIRVAEAGQDSDEEVESQGKAEAARKAAAKVEADQRAEETKAVKAGLIQAAKLKKEGNARAAEKLVAELTHKYPNNLAVQLVNGLVGFEKAVSESDKLTKQNEQAFVLAMRDVEKAGIPTSNDIEFPKDWKERTAKRRDAAAPSEAELRMLRSLESPIDFRYKNSRFQEVMDHISTTMNRTIVVDASALNEVSVTYDTPISFSAREALTARSGLRAVLAQLNLTYVVRDGIIHVTTSTRARDLMTTKVYYLGDLIVGAGPFGGSPTIGMMLDQVQLVNNMTALVEMIQGAVDPTSWEKKGGVGHLGVNIPTLSLTVRQSQEVHLMLRATLYGKGF